MVWFKVDDNLAFHHKTLKAGNAAMGLWVRAGSEISQQLTDGFVPNKLVELLGGKSLARRLVASELWHEVEGGYTFHEWNERQPTRADIEEERHAARERKKRWKERRQNDDGTPSGTRSDTRSEHRPERVRNNAHARAATRPDPTRPVKDKERELAAIHNPTDQILEDHAAAYTTRPAKTVLDATRRHITTLLNDGSPENLIRAGLTKMRDKQLAPRLLPELVAEVTPTNGSYTPDQIATLTEGQLLNLGMYGTIHAPSSHP